MARNASGTYTLPTGNPVVSGTLIDATWANNTLADLGNEMTDSLSRSGEGAMLAPLRITDGVQATPSLAFSNEPSSGLYRAGSNEWWAVAAGVQNLRFTNLGLTTRAAAGAVGTPSIAAFGDVDTGIYFPGANELAIATGGVGALWVNSSQNVGIGTTSPAAKLQVKSSAAQAVNIEGTTARGSGNIFAAFLDPTGRKGYIGYGTSVDDGFFIANEMNAYMAFQTNATERMRLDSSGNLGIGTTGTITNKLEVSVASGADRNIFLAGVSGASNGLYVQWNHATTKTHVRIADIPTSSAGLPAGTIWNDSGTLKIT